MTITNRDMAFKELYEALHDMRDKDSQLFEVMEKAAPLIAEINRELYTLHENK